MADTGAVVHVIRTNGGTHHLLEDVVVLIDASRAGEACNRIGAVLCLDAREFLRYKGECLIPAGLFEDTLRIFNQRCGHTVTGRDELIGAKSSLNA